MNLHINSDKKKTDTQPQDVVSLINSILAKAMDAGASDVHFEPMADEIVIKFRLDGILEVVERLPGSLSDNIISRLKVLGGLLTYRNDIPQEGRISIKSGDKRITDQRLAVFPTIYGQRAVVRFFYQHKELTTLSQLGFSEEIHKNLKKIATQQQGLLLLTGPAGSGKSTTLAAILRYILKHFSGKSIVTLEDPVEIRIDGVTQVQIPPHGEMTFASALRSLLRQDPEVLMIGEIRDAETAKIAIEAGLTGHFLMTTMHSGTPAGALLRLLEMGIESYQITSSVSAVLNQRLVRRLCSNCKKHDDQKKFRPVGCESCLNTGYHGRAMIAELVEMDSLLRKAVLEKADIEELEKILKEKDHKTILHDGRRLVNDSITTIDEINKVCGIIKS
ncbi:MAG: type II/IV secretion system protein [Planctomycetes bacterium]|nr:type II/IV secretion system protein [Planctomycetota bacterium]MBL7107387.1 type II/IV secretion system protein [Phycisphaerae bacterium]